MKCKTCNASGVRLYRPYGEFRRPERDRCNGCISYEMRDWYVPLIIDEEENAWGYTSVPQTAIEKFCQLPENERGWSWDCKESRWSVND